MRSPKRRGFIGKPVTGVDFMKIMRRCFVAFISILLIFMCILPVCAKSKNYNINELKMSIAFPEEMSVVTRKTEGVVLADGVYLRAKTHDNALTMMIIMVHLLDVVMRSQHLIILMHMFLLQFRSR